MAIIAIDKTLDVITKYNSLITESLDTAVSKRKIL